MFYHFNSINSGHRGYSNLSVIIGYRWNVEYLFYAKFRVIHLQIFEWFESRSRSICSVIDVELGNGFKIILNISYTRGWRELEMAARRGVKIHSILNESIIRLFGLSFKIIECPVFHEGTECS